MEFIERDFNVSEEKDYAFNIKKRMLFYQAIEATPVHIVCDGVSILAGWLLRHRRTFNS